MKILNVLIALSILIGLVSCGKSLIMENDTIPLKQFGDGIIEFSSEYHSSPGPWSSFVVLGTPDTYPKYGDIQTAWASKTSDGADEFLAIAFDTAQYVDKIEIYETYNPGAVTSIAVRNKENGSWSPVYETSADSKLPKKSRILEVDIAKTTFLVDAIRLNVSSRKVSGWNEIDAVAISGFIED